MDPLAVAPTSVKLDTAGLGTYATTVTGFELWPLNADKGRQARPWKRIDLPSYASSTSFTAGQRVQVTAQFGWPSVPEDVRLATIQLTAILLLQSPRATTSVDQIGNVIGMSASGRDIVTKLLDAYPRLPAVA